MYNSFASKHDLGEPLPPTKFKAMLPSNSHGPQGGAHTHIQTTAESLARGQIALPAPVPTTWPKEPLSASES